MKISYASRADVLYVILENTENTCAYLETGSGAILRIDQTTDRVVGITIPDFSRVGEISIPELDIGISSAKLLQFTGENK